MDLLVNIVWTLLALCAVLLTGIVAVGRTNRHRGCSVSVVRHASGPLSRGAVTIELAGYAPGDSAMLYEALDTYTDRRVDLTKSIPDLQAELAKRSGQTVLLVPPGSDPSEWTFAEVPEAHYTEEPTDG